MSSPDRPEAIFEPFESDEPVRFQSLADLGDVEPGPIVPSGDTRGAAIPGLPAQSHPSTRGAAGIEAWKDQDLARVQREDRETLERAVEVRRRHHVKTLGARRAHRGPSRERRPGSCRTTGSRRGASTRSSSRGGDSGDGDPEGEHDLRTVTA
jgi:hypothetical protein